MGIQYYYYIYAKVYYASIPSQFTHSLKLLRVHLRNARTTALLSVDSQSQNPAFSRYNSKTKTLYTCTEYLEKDGDLYSYRMDPETGGLTLLSKQSAKGTSLDRRRNRHSSLTNAAQII